MRRHKDRARALRRGQTDAEKMLWYRLRDRQLAGAKFRRQHPIGPFIVDFVCLEAGLVVELDGGQHAERRSEDARRTASLQSKGFRVLRFWNTDLRDLESVLTVIRDNLRIRHPSARVDAIASDKNN